MPRDIASSPTSLLASSPIPIASDIAAGKLAYDAAQRGDVQNAVLNALGILPMVPALGGATVFHGSPFKFKKFKKSAIGTGEGGQAYGYGHYFADRPETAGRYVPPGGTLYKVDLPDEHIEKMLDFDKPIGEQPPHVRQALRSIFDGQGKGELFDFYEKQGLTGEALQGRLDAALGLNEEKISLAMERAGIPGIKYLDEGSRGKGKGTLNYVVFNPKHAKIIGENK